MLRSSLCLILKLNNNKSWSVFEISFTSLRHERCYLTLSSAPSLPRLTAFTFAFLGHHVPLASETIGQYVQVKIHRPNPHHCFSTLQLWERVREREGALCANLTLFPRKIHSWTLLSCLSHYGGESFSLPTGQAARSAIQTARPRARRIGGEIAHVCLLHI